MSNLFIGIMSGTSRDSLDACLVDFTDHFEIIATETLDFHPNYKTSVEIPFISSEITNKSVEIVKNLIHKSSMSKSKIVGIGFSGQTISHDDHHSLQAGDPKKISKLTNIDVFSDFRNKNIAEGGRGAPLIPDFHKYIFSETGKRKLIINIGGISNGTYLDGEKIAAASDIGPGNCLLDFVMTSSQLGDYDKDGQIASNGTINNLIKDELMSSFMNMGYPRADDITAYIEPLLTRFEEYKKIPVNELLRTLVEVTAEKIKEFYEYCDYPDEVIFHGGGTLNKTLMKSIAEKVRTDIQTTDHIVPSRYMESSAFAYLAYADKGVLFK